MAQVDEKKLLRMATKFVATDDTKPLNPTQIAIRNMLIEFVHLVRGEE
jgi:hypothetical protein